MDLPGDFPDSSRIGFPGERQSRSLRRVRKSRKRRAGCVDKETHSRTSTVSLRDDTADEMRFFLVLLGKTSILTHVSDLSWHCG